MGSNKDAAETLPGLRVLWIEDSPDDAALVLRVLTKSGFTIVPRRVDEPGELRAALASFHPDLVLGDFSLPRLGGLEAIAIVREAQPDVPYVVVTGSVDEETAAACIKAGADDYVLKERLQHLPRAVRSAMEAREVRVARRQAEAELRLRTSALEAAADGVVIADREGTIVWVNPAFSLLTGYSPGEAIGKKPSILKSGVHPEAFYRQLWETILAGQTWRGEIFNRRKDGSVYLEEMSITPVAGPEGSPSHFVAVKRDMTEKRRQEEAIRTLATKDLLTGLPNQTVLRQDLESSTRRAHGGESGVLMLLDLDRFAVVNDALGHEAGDRLFVHVADAIANVLPPGALVYRFGGDELAILQDGIPFAQALDLAERIRAQVGAFRYGAAGAELSITASLGIVPVDGSLEPTPLLSLADAALQQAKQTGRDRVVPLRSEDDRPHRLGEEGRWATVVREGLRKGHFRLHIQKIVRISDAAVDHHEALLRLVSPSDGKLIPPGAFLPAAEAYGLMPAIDEWVAREGIRILNEVPSLRIHLNVSAQGLGDRRLLETIVHLVEEASLAPGRLGFEITESAAIADLTSLQTWALHLRELGCTLAVDDFGTGFCSFAYLRKLPVDLIKIDGSFIRSIEDDPTNQAIVRSIVGIAQALGKQVVAEMVETESAAEILLGLGVEFGQGWYWGRAEPVRAEGDNRPARSGPP